MPQVEIQSFQFREHAFEYLDGAEKLHEVHGRANLPKYFLACQAIELAIKAYLRLQGRDTKWLKRNIGHDIAKGLSEVRNSGLTGISPVFHQMVEDLSDIYNDKQFQYFDRSVISMPGLKKVCSETRDFLELFREDCDRELGGFLKQHFGKPQKVPK